MKQHISFSEVHLQRMLSVIARDLPDSALVDKPTMYEAVRAQLGGKAQTTTVLHLYALCARGRATPNYIVKILQHCVSERPDRPDYLIDLGRQLFESGKRNEGVKVLYSAMPLCKDTAEDAVLLAQHLVLAGLPGVARSFLDSCSIVGNERSTLAMICFRRSMGQGKDLMALRLKRHVSSCVEDIGLRCEAIHHVGLPSEARHVHADLFKVSVCAAADDDCALRLRCERGIHKDVATVEEKVSAEAQTRSNVLLRRVTSSQPEETDSSNRSTTFLRLASLYYEKRLYRKVLRVLTLANKVCRPGKSEYILRARCEVALGHTDAALESLSRAIDKHPGDADLRFEYSLLLLRQGSFGEGMKQFEWRHAALTDSSRCRPLEAPLWTGQPIRNKRVALICEQGLGDTLHFLRYAESLSTLGALVFLHCQPRLMVLLGRCTFLKQVFSLAESDAYAEYSIPLMSLPVPLGSFLQPSTVRPAALTVDPVKQLRWKKHIDIGQGRLKVGLSWAGNPASQQDINRSMHLSSFIELGVLDGVDFYSLQRGDAAREAVMLPMSFKLKQVHSPEEGIDDTAALIVNLDLIISVDTMIAHLAGSLNKRTWLLLPKVADWRHGTSGQASPLYPSVRCLRCVADGEWQSVIDTIRVGIKHLVQQMAFRSSVDEALT